jgi:hypothetical protein
MTISPTSDEDPVEEAREFNTEIAACGLNPQKAHVLIKTLASEVERLKAEVARLQESQEGKAL